MSSPNWADEMTAPVAAGAEPSNQPQPDETPLGRPALTAPIGGKQYPYYNQPKTGNEGPAISGPPGKPDWASEVQTPDAKPIMAPRSGPVEDARANQGSYSAILNSFQQGAAHGWGNSTLGDDLIKTLEKNGVLDDGTPGSGTIPKAFNEAFIRPLADGLDLGLKTMSAAFEGLHDAAVTAAEGQQTGSPDEIIEAFKHPVQTAGAVTAAAMEAFPLGTVELGRLGWYPGYLPKPGVVLKEGAPVPVADSPIFYKNGKAAPPEANLRNLNPDELVDASKAQRERLITLHDTVAKMQKGEAFVPPLREAAETHVIGPEPAEHPMELKSPAEAAYRGGETMDDTMNRPQSVGGAATPYEEKVFLPAAEPFEQDAWQQNFDQWVTKLETSDDARNLIRNVADAHDNFPDAIHHGQISEQARGILADSLGSTGDEINSLGVDGRLKRDSEFRAAAQLMLRLQDEVFKAAEANRTPSFETRQALVQALMKHDAAVEYVLGLRGEWGRTGNAMQEFLEQVEDSSSLTKFLKDKGKNWGANDLDKIGDMLHSLPTRAARSNFLKNMRKPDFTDRAVYYWTNAILSGPITHLKYILANSAYVAYDTLMARPAAGVAGAVRQALSDEEIDRVYLGETVAKIYGLVKGTPDAIWAAGQAIKHNTPTLTAGQVLQRNVAAAKAAEKLGVAAAPVTANPITGLKPIGGALGQAVSVPSRVVGGIHSFFNHMVYRSEIEAQAYRAAAKSGLKPTDPQFWKSQAFNAEFPTDEMIDAADYEGARANFTQDLPPVIKSLQGTLYKSKWGRFLMPFVKVPINIVRTVQEGTPLAYLDPAMRKDLDGRNGGAAQDMARGRMAAGAAIMATTAYYTLQDRITGNGPIDPTERAQWLLTHQPFSIKVGNEWKSFDRFGPVGMYLGVAANITDAIKVAHDAYTQNRITKKDSEKFDASMQEALNRGLLGLGKVLGEAGGEDLINFASLLTDPKGSSSSKVGYIASTQIPYSSFLRQTGSIIDPEARKINTFVDALKATIPVARETLLPSRDWTGQIVPNPMFATILRTRETPPDKVSSEMQRLDIKPGLPPQTIGGIHLEPEEYDDFLSQAGTATKMGLDRLVNLPNWEQLPDYTKTKFIRQTIESARGQAKVAIQLKYRHLIQDGLDNRLEDMNGGTPKSSAYQRPK